MTDEAGWELGPYQGRVTERLAEWTGSNASTRVWDKDPSFWPNAAPASVASRLGWLRLPEAMREKLGELTEFVEGVQQSGFLEVVLLGMGGSSLAPEVFASTFGRKAGYPDLRVLDSTHPDAVRALRDSLDLTRTLFLVSSKSGSTLEPNAFFRYFWGEVALANPAPGAQFVAITDPGTTLETLARERQFRGCFPATADVGGRFSALTAFGLVPAALVGIDIGATLERAGRMAKACRAGIAAEDHPGLRLGAALGELARAGRNKVTFLASPALAAFPSWAEQLIAESTGKSGTGIVPVVEEIRPLDPPLGPDRVFVYLHLTSTVDADVEAGLEPARRAGVPVLRFELSEALDLGPEFFRWEFAVAAAGAVLGIDPFDQPDVELAKDLARKAMQASSGAPSNDSRPPPANSTDPTLPNAIRRWADGAKAGDYVGLQAYLAPTPSTTAALQTLRSALRSRLGLATTLGFGPRFLHSTGQLHKGGPPGGRFLQLVDRPVVDVKVPGADYTFGEVIHAQAAGDADALRQAHRRILTVDLGSTVSEGLSRLVEAVDG